MCDYCDCRELAPIGELSAEHERITRLASELRDALGSADEPRATAALAALAGALGPHLAKEERGLLAELAARDGFDWYVAELLADHERARSGILATRSAGPAERDLLLVELDDLAHHIETEEYDLFPASRLILDDAAWSAVAAAHRSAPPGAAIAPEHAR